MHFSSFLSLLLPLLSFISSIHAWDCSLLFQEELQNLGFTQLASLFTTINQTSVGQDLISKISQGNYTFFAPSNEAIGNVSSEVSGNSTLFAEYLSYHFVHGNFQNVSSSSNGSNPTSSTTSASSSTSSSITSSSTTSSSTSETSSGTASATASLLGRFFRRRTSRLDSSSSPQLESGIFPNTTLGRTLLNASELVQLPGNNSQVLAWTRNDENSNVTILNQVQNITVVNSTQWGTIFINGINGVLIPPGNITTALNATNATVIFNLLESIQIPSSNGTNETATEFLQEAVGITFFAPNNAAFIGVVNQTISSLQNNVSALAAVLENHYINGTVLYSPEIQLLGQNSSSSSNSSSSNSSSSTPTNATSAAGEPLQFVTNSSGTFVESNGLSAKIVRPDVLIDNGVIHIIDTVLLNNASDPSAASSAYASATSAAASITTENGPIGVPTSGTSTASSGSSSSTSSSSSSASSSSSSSSTTSSGSATSTTSTSETSTSGGTLTVTASA